MAPPKALSAIKSFLSSPYGQLFKIAISALIIGIFVYTVDWNEFFRLIKEVKTSWLLVILFIIIFRNFVSGFRFHLLSSVFKNVSTWILTKHYFIGSMFNLFLPTTIGGDGIRVFLLAEEGIEKKDGLLLVLVERFIGFFSFILFSFFACFLVDIPNLWRLGIVGIFVAYAGLVALAIFVPDKGSELPVVGAFIKSFHQLKKHKKLLFYTLLVSVFYQFISILMRYFVAVAFGIEVPLMAFLAFIPLINIVTLLPISFGGVGLREAAFVFFFAQVGLSQEEAILISVGSFIALTITGIIGALIYFYDKIFKNVQYDLDAAKQ